MDRGAWWAAVYGVAQSWTGLKLLSSSNGETDIENRPMDMEGGEEGQGEMYGESNIDIYNTMCKTYSQ